MHHCGKDVRSDLASSWVSCGRPAFYGVAWGSTFGVNTTQDMTEWTLEEDLYVGHHHEGPRRTASVPCLAMEKENIPDWGEEQKSWKWRWATHVMRRDDVRWS